jgi:ribosomal protein S18 acetylase RimI-like enzyme
MSQPVAKQPTDLSVRPADLHQRQDQSAVLELLDMYAREPLGSGEPLALDVRERLIPDLQRLANCRAFLAFQDDRPVGLAICFLGYSSFQARPLLNIHDLAVTPQMRGQGVGRALLQAIEAEARRSGCCRLTLEVRADNVVARRLYQDFGFNPGDPASDSLSFWKKPLD